MVFVFITIACNAPNFIYGIYISFQDEDYKDVWRLSSEKDVDICAVQEGDPKPAEKSTLRFWFDQLQFFQVVLMIIQILNDPFTYRYIKINVLGCHSKSRKTKQLNM